jgi:hypothetical protein
MRLTVNLLTSFDGEHLRLIRAGEEIDARQVPENARRFEERGPAPADGEARHIKSRVLGEAKF